MKVLIAGATGAVGKSLVPMLRQREHKVAALIRSASSASAAEALGAGTYVADALDAAAVREAARSFQPDVIVNQLTALGDLTDLRDFKAGFERTNELRTRGTANLLDAAREVKARRFVCQGYCGWPLARVGNLIKTETDPLDPGPLPAFRDTFKALVAMEAAVRTADFVSGVVLRYGSFYGPGSALAPGGSFFQDVERRRVPLVGNAEGMFSFIHLADVAGATTAAIEGAATGVFHVTDDNPAPVREWLPFLAELLGAKPPRHVPAWLAKLILPKHLYVLMTSVRGCSNRRFKNAFGWTPRFPSWRDGFRDVLQGPASTTPR